MKILDDEPMPDFDLPPIDAYQQDFDHPDPTEQIFEADGDATAAAATEIARLAALDPVAYDRQREPAAAKLGIRVGTLDRQVREARAASRQKSNTTSPEFSDDFLALQFSAEYADRLRYTALFGQWNEWTGTHWRGDETVNVFALARGVCRAIAQDAPFEDAKSIASAATIAAVERLARNDRRHAATADEWDADEWLLNTPGGTVDLRTGKMRAHRPTDHITKITAITPGGACPMWRGFLGTVTNGNVELQLFLQRMAGLALTGSTREHALFFAYGTGGNGKGVFLNTLTGIMNDYATVASMETFTSSQSDRHPADLAMLRGARLVTAQETEEGRKWAESRIKALTGGDPITARFMRQDFFTFIPQFKLIIAGNHKPGLRNVDEAIRRRLNLIPFDVKIVASEKDVNLPEKLKAEWPGILLWMIDGCLLWQEKGLCQPAAVQDATTQYLEAEDAFGLWLAERCVVGKAYESLSSNLFGSWSEWATKAGEHVGSQKSFSQALLSRGFASKKYSDGKMGFVGINAARATTNNHSGDQ